ncbi:MAG: UDP-N-acetylmuramoyl-tripeptide--D-alanyl-D-alanine ligase [uncultured Acidimicrobiales bacterium]|uniref:UDP-N-acetylmuramoyl-tripeptide--D-alanyl-D-alanine ligase n=1 Tax=uncultured Acidimicrobiales bacterium TaxID=310071 RepID=A0A6J4I340_9ACTN|nr:MAG: UDP-N-acetylmuramoyl-tripeptide--D-alanyl-D-alanine ligase [uncultured Acidimicrobiales bacterium]
MRLRAAALASACGGVLHGADVEVDGASNDTRSLRPGQLFVPVVAERDGHDFIAAALAGGAAAYLTARPPVGGTAIRVDDTAAALLSCGRLARDSLPDRVVGVTGSVGKTSVKDLLAAALAGTLRTAASERSFNNELGVPMTLLGAPDGTEAVVLEMGARGAGHIRRLCEVGRPTVGVVTSVAAVHTELFGSLDEVAAGKGELVESLPPSGTAVLNADDERVAAMAGRTTARVLSYGDSGEVRADQVACDDELRPSFRLRTPWGSAPVGLAVRGVHQVGNALAAAAAALACGVPLDAAADGLGRAVLSPLRMDLQRTQSGAIVLNDAYNANPTSMAAALRALAALPGRGRRIAVLGPMAELAEPACAHAEVASLAAELGVEVIAAATHLYGPDPAEDPVVAVGPLGRGDAVLVKASRAAGLERVAEALLST